MASDNVTEAPSQPSKSDGQRSDSDDATRPLEMIANTAELVRIATMVQTMVEEVRNMSLDDAGRRRLVQVHEQAVGTVKERVSERLREELAGFAMPLDEGDASEAELRVAQAQLIGWLNGLFFGIQAAVMQQQALAQLGQVPSALPVQPAAGPPGASERRDSAYL